MSETITEILKAEDKADSIIRNAEAEKAKILSKAREQTVELTASHKKEVDADASSRVKKEFKAIETECSKIMTKYRREAENIAKNASIKKAVDFIISKI